MNWSEVQVFLAVARSGQLQAAGRQLGVDRTTVGRRLEALEARLGTPLFRRTRDGTHLTAAGERALAHAQAMEAAAQAMERDAAPEQDVVGLVRLAVTEAVAPFLVEQGLLDVADAHPGLRLELLAGNRRADLEAGEADLALRVDPVRGAELRARCVSRSSIALYASREYVRRRGAPKSADQLDGHEVAMPSGELAQMPEAGWLAAQPGLVVRLQSNSMPTLVAAARAGRGIVALTTSWGDREAALTHLFDVPDLPPRAIWLVSTAASAKRPACAVVMQRLAAVFAEVRVR